ncbi:MAG: phosphohistidine phosphatase SixA [Gemmatimonadota bacterium]|nr:MAG: phosphohistidine phosphatase SixA [Gemmatimonadota bacterium]
MEVYLVQHGEAQRKEEDPERPLTEKGKDDVRKVAAFLSKSNVRVYQIRHSGKKRAEETALILGDHLSPPSGVKVHQGLAPNDDVTPVAEILQLENEPVMIVSHLPFLIRLASLLITDNEEKTVVQFRMGGCVCLVTENGNWTVEWVVTPDLLSD